MRQKLKTNISFRRIFGALGLVVLVFASQVFAAAAQTASTAYRTEEVLQRSTVVTYPDDTATVAPATYENLEDVFGVVVDPGDTLLSLSDATATKAYVVTSGQFAVLVSNEAGPIAPGDYLTVSHVAGVAMKASDESRVVARALEGFQGADDAISTATVTTELGEAAVSLGRVHAEIGVIGNPLLSTGKTDRNFLYQLADTIAEREVNPVRVYISLVVLFVSGAVAGLLLYAGIRNGMIAIGRNPLSRKSIVRSLFQVVITGFTILLLGVFGVYLLLRL